MRRPIDLKMTGDAMDDGTYTLTLVISNLVSADQANRVALWVRRALKDNVSQIGVLPAPDDGWQDISTAPKDGTTILVFTVYGEIQLSKWCTLNNFEGCWDSDKPTHWRLLPPPPERKE